MINLVTSNKMRIDTEEVKQIYEYKYLRHEIRIGRND